MSQWSSPGTEDEVSTATLAAETSAILMHTDLPLRVSREHSQQGSVPCGFGEEQTLHPGHKET